MGLRGEKHTAPAQSAYIPYIQKAIEERKREYEEGYGALYDVNGDGIEELIMVYTKYLSQSEMEIPHKVCSVYTLSDEGVKTLLKEASLFIEAGGPFGYAGVVQIDGKNYIAVTRQTGETGAGRILRYGFWKLYAYSGGTAKPEFEVEYNCLSEEGKIFHDESSAVINGESCSYQEYLNWKDSMKELLEVDAYGDDHNPPESVMTLQALLEALGN